MLGQKGAELPPPSLSLCSHIQQSDESTQTGRKAPLRLAPRVPVQVVAPRCHHGSYLGHHVVGPDVGGQGEVSLALPL